MTPDLPDDEADRREAEPGVLDDPIRLLIADDDEETTLVLRDSLPAYGFEVVGNARNGAEAGEKVAALHPEVVLMDLRMPGVDGIEATVQIKAREPKTQVVILTAYSSGDARDLAEFMGAADLVEKNAPLEKIVSRLRAAALAYRTSE
jgi:DNA-binding NarL/FixJ family response regulator